MVSPPTPTGRRALVAAAWLTTVLAGLIGAVGAVAWALEGGPQPSAASVSEATRLDLPEGTAVLEADLAQMQSPNPGDRAEITLDVPADAFDDFLTANAMDTPLLAGTTPAGTASGVIPAGCTAEACYAASIVIDEDTVTVRLTVTLL
ncbi:hypothetical protein K3N28_09350 [Glycomyces sp. TRM65418]|uniref:hypothetical protein n=1 Tax=Glycomyces sp. TRM65418 TaxID=2867006 RepID=UPI001CE6C431|nr:hypothetical protein [Glycomyces sp. TRM65418]MCC3763276.1 hypothetical protein [Glycomyces sp. TRM65418]QZD57276.1 hypothetical protein K3N28_09290 [Glycomyces sp. TRM65418]